MEISDEQRGIVKMACWSLQKTIGLNHYPGAVCCVNAILDVISNVEQAWQNMEDQYHRGDYDDLMNPELKQPALPGLEVPQKTDTGVRAMGKWVTLEMIRSHGTRLMTRGYTALEALCECLVYFGLSQRSMARLLGISHTTLSLALTGKKLRRMLKGILEDFFVEKQEAK